LVIALVSVILTIWTVHTVAVVSQWMKVHLQ